MTIPISFKEMQFTYDYNVAILGLKSEGGIEGKVRSVSAKVRIGFDFKNSVAFLDEFYFTNPG